MVSFRVHIGEFITKAEICLMQNDTILQKVLAHLRNHLSAKLIANLLKFKEHFFLRKKETLFFF
jgi:hypothetical protein